jgi:DNA-binding NtrC family response regulator
MLRLALRYKEQIQYFPLPDRDVQLGAAAENDLVASFPGISRHHAKLRPEGAGVLVTDLGSTNGLVRDGRRLDEVLLTPGKAVRLGHAVLALEDLSSSDAETGLRFQTPAGHEAAGSLATETAALFRTAGASPAAALRFVRELEHTGGANLDEKLGHARRALGARSLLIFDLRNPGDPTVVACEGPLPSESELDDLAAMEFDTTGKPLLVVASGGLRLIALVKGNPEPWQQDFFAYLAERLLPGVSAASPEDFPHPDEGLRVPRGMVVGTSAAMQDLLAQVKATARSDLSILLLGETGTGKELFARLIHDSSPRVKGPFIALNCAAIPAELLEYELFGIGSRVATGVDPREGFFVQAHGGTLFLDEIGDMPERLQAKLLRALQEREVLPLGSSEPRKVDVRIVAASNRHLDRLVKEGLFRADLYYRLRGLELRLPPLRERRDDLPALLFAFASRSAARYGKRVHGVSRRALSALLAHDWPGNVRELEATIERAVLLCPDGGTLQREHVGSLDGLRNEEQTDTAILEPPRPPTRSSEPFNLQEQVDDLERRMILDAFAAAKGNRTRAARMLGITRNGLALKMRRLRIDPERIP